MFQTVEDAVMWFPKNGKQRCSYSTEQLPGVGGGVSAAVCVFEGTKKKRSDN